MTYKYEMEQMVAKHQGLVRSVALRLSSVYGEELEDMMQIGYIGLIKAVKGFDETRGYKFSTYAVPLIAGEIKMYMRDHNRIKVSRSVKKDAAYVRKAQNEYQLEKGRTPRISEIAAMTDLDEERVRYVMQADDAMKNFEEYEKIDVMTNDEEKNIMRIDLQKVMEQLDPMEKKVMLLRYYKDMTQTAAAKILNISQVQVYRIEQRALKNMAELLDS